MLRWCDLVLRAAAPMVPYDIRRDWLREWRAEFAYAAARAARSAGRMPIASLWRARRRESACRAGCAGIAGGWK